MYGTYRYTTDISYTQSPNCNLQVESANNFSQNNSLTAERLYYSSQLPSVQPSCSVLAQVLRASSLVQSQAPPASSPQLSLQMTITLPPGQQHAAAVSATPQGSRKPNETSLEYKGF